MPCPVTVGMQWGTKGAFQLLTNLTLSNNAISGTIPSSWGYATSFPELVQVGRVGGQRASRARPPNTRNTQPPAIAAAPQLDLTHTRLCGTVPSGLEDVDLCQQGSSERCIWRPCDPAVLAAPPPPPPSGGGAALAPVARRSSMAGLPQHQLCSTPALHMACRRLPLVVLNQCGSHRWWSGRWCG